MRLQKYVRLIVIIAACTCGATFSFVALAQGDEAPRGDGFDSGYDVVIVELCDQFKKDPALAQDAARKLASMGRRAVDTVSEVLKENLAKKEPNPQTTFYCVWSLSRIKSGAAAAALLPILKDDKKPADLRMLAVEALGMELIPDGIAALQSIAESDADSALQKKAFMQLALIPESWAKSETLFINALSNPSDEIRGIASKQCYFAHIYLNAADKLIELAEKDSVYTIRVNAVLALERMRIKRAVPMLVRIANDPQTTAPMLSLVLKSIGALGGGYSFKDVAALNTWWTRNAEEFNKLLLPKEGDPVAAPAANAAPATAAPVETPKVAAPVAAPIRERPAAVETAPAARENVNTSKAPDQESTGERRRRELREAEQARKRLKEEAR
jgi:HEAT repeat protein